MWRRAARGHHVLNKVVGAWRAMLLREDHHPHFTSTTLPSNLPNTSGVYIASACVEGSMNVPGVVTRAWYLYTCSPAESHVANFDSSNCQFFGSRREKFQNLLLPLLNLEQVWRGQALVIQSRMRTAGGFEKAPQFLNVRLRLVQLFVVEYHILISRIGWRLMQLLLKQLTMRIKG